MGEILDKTNVGGHMLVNVIYSIYNSLPKKNIKFLTAPSRNIRVLKKVTQQV